MRHECPGQAALSKFKGSVIAVAPLAPSLWFVLNFNYLSWFWGTSRHFVRKKNEILIEKLAMSNFVRTVLWKPLFWEISVFICHIYLCCSRSYIRKSVLYKDTTMFQQASMTSITAHESIHGVNKHVISLIPFIISH